MRTTLSLALALQLVAAAATAQDRSLSPDAYAAEMLRARRTVAATVDGLRRTYRLANDAVSAALVGGGFAAVDVAGHWIAAERQAGDQVARWLVGARAAPRTAFEAVTRHTRAGVDRTAAAVLAGVDLRAAATREEWAGVLRQTGLTAVQVVGLVASDPSLPPEEKAAALQKAGYTPTEIAAALAAERTRASEIFRALRQLGIDERGAAVAGRDALRLDAARTIADMLEGGYEEVESARAVGESHGATAQSVASPLRVIGLTVKAIFMALAGLLTAGAVVVAALPLPDLFAAVAILLSAGFGAEETAQGLREAGVDAGNAAAAFLQSTNVSVAQTAAALTSAFDLDAGQNVTTLHEAGASLEDALGAVGDLEDLSADELIALFLSLNLQDQDEALFEVLEEYAEEKNEAITVIARWLAQRGFTQTRIASGLRDYSQLDAPPVAEALVDAGFTSADVVAEALVSAGFTAPLTVGAALAAAGFNAAQVSAALTSALQLTLQEIQQVILAVFGAGAAGA